MFSKKLVELQSYLINSNHNAKFTMSFNKGQWRLIKKVKENVAIVTYSFSNEWDSGIQLNFNCIDGKFIFSNFGAFKFRNDKYDTPTNNKIISSFIKDIENL